MVPFDSLSSFLCPILIPIAEKTSQRRSQQSESKEAFLRSNFERIKSSS